MGPFLFVFQSLLKVVHKSKVRSKNFKLKQCGKFEFIWNQNRFQFIFAQEIIDKAMEIAVAGYDYSLFILAIVNHCLQY